MTQKEMLKDFIYSTYWISYMKIKEERRKKYLKFMIYNYYIIYLQLFINCGRKQYIGISYTKYKQYLSRQREQIRAEIGVLLVDPQFLPNMVSMKIHGPGRYIQ